MHMDIGEWVIINIRPWRNKSEFKKEGNKDDPLKNDKTSIIGCVPVHSCYWDVLIDR